jgi:hypothetical protein
LRSHAVRGKHPVKTLLMLLAPVGVTAGLGAALLALGRVIGAHLTDIASRLLKTGVNSDVELPCGAVEDVLIGHGRASVSSREA